MALVSRNQNEAPSVSCKNQDKETAYEGYMNPEPGFQSGPGDSVDAD